ncbi:MAG TPA: phenylacetate--CoA ligase family protein [Streptosporangiaceae bacterium]|jgi:phenylacetate-CoA ligase|nr:phenylacetate--CoA ligase family protein [Streptosporangiaceae bacterium]
MDRGRAGRVLRGLEEFYADGPAQSAGPAGAAALALFHDAARTVPAYAAFLRSAGVDPGGIRTSEDFDQLPMLTKDTYQRRYPLNELCRGGRLDGCDMVAVSSGSSGSPTVWPRSVLDERAVAARFEQVFRDGFLAGSRSTLAVICFALGSWVGGMYTAACCRHLAAKGYPITVVTPGNDLAEILRVVAELGPLFDQVVLAGYPPFVKNVVDAGLAHGIDWPAYRIKLVLAGEVFSEEWRDLMGRRAGLTAPLADSASLYGTADAGVLGTETPLSVSIRRFLAGRPDALRELAGQSRLPTLVQYDPMTRYFQAAGTTLLFSCDGATPLVRYHIADEGGLVGFDELLEFCGRHGHDPLAEVGSDLSGGHGAPALPFAYVFGRSLFTVSYYGANIYPENVTVALERPGVSEWVTGKFVLQAAETADRDRELRVVVELAPGQAGSEERAAELAEAIRAELRRLNSEFAHYVPDRAQLPVVDLRPAGDPEYFPPGVKHRYTRPSARSL